MSLNYVRPRNTKEALEIKRRDPTSKYIGGGSSLQKKSYDCTLIDLQLLPLNKIENNNGLIFVGSLVSLEALCQYFKDFTELVYALKIEGSKNQRNQSSLGGFIKNADGRSPFLTCLMSMEVWVITEPYLKRQHLIDFLKERVNCEDLIVGIEFPTPDSIRFESLGRSPMDKPVVCCATTFYNKKQTLSFGGFGKYPIICDQIIFEMASSKYISELNIEDDSWATSEYRKEMINLLFKRMQMN